jgi:pimeloyl-ACP methyl ester carboxylesterase
LAEGYLVIAMDVRDHDGPGKPKEDEAYGAEMMADVVRLLDHLNIQKAHVVGYSMGGMITMKLLTRHPDRVRSEILGGMGWLRQGGPLQQSWPSPRAGPGGNSSRLRSQPRHARRERGRGEGHSHPGNRSHQRERFLPAALRRPSATTV